MVIQVLEGPITKSEVEKLVKRNFDSNVEIVSYHVEAYSDEKVGFLGAHKYLIITLKRKDDDKEEIKTFFLKHIPYDIEKQADLIKESNVFLKEMQFYKNVVPELLKSSSGDSWIAQCYLAKDDVLLLEDLKLRNFKVRDKILDVTALKSALTALAKLHASSMLAEKRLGKSFLELHPETFVESVFSQGGRFDDFLKSALDVCVGVAERLHLETKNLPKFCEKIFQGVASSKTRRNVVCHGDAWSNNLMFDDSKPLPRCVLIDFQLVRYAPAVTDVLLLLYLTTTRKFREDQEIELLKYYHGIFCETYSKDDSAGSELLPSFDQVEQEYEELRIVGLVTAAYYFPFILVDGKLCAELTSDSDGFDSFLFKDRVNLVLNFMQKDDSYSNRIAEIMTELVERSEKMVEL